MGQQGSQIPVGKKYRATKAAGTSPWWIHSAREAMGPGQHRPPGGWIPFRVISGHFHPVVGLGKSRPKSANLGQWKTNAGENEHCAAKPPPPPPPLFESHGPPDPWKGSQVLNMHFISLSGVVLAVCCLLAAATVVCKPPPPPPTQTWTERGPNPTPFRLGTLIKTWYRDRA